MNAHVELRTRHLSAELRMQRATHLMAVLAVSGFQVAWESPLALGLPAGAPQYVVVGLALLFLPLARGIRALQPWARWAATPLLALIGALMVACALAAEDRFQLALTLCGAGLAAASLAELHRPAHAVLFTRAYHAAIENTPELDPKPAPPPPPTDWPAVGLTFAIGVLAIVATCWWLSTR